jgi:hypothetical protein
MNISISGAHTKNMEFNRRPLRRTDTVIPTCVHIMHSMQRRRNKGTISLDLSLSPSEPVV